MRQVEDEDEWREWERGGKEGGTKIGYQDLNTTRGHFLTKHPSQKIEETNSNNTTLKI